ncbi:hypothetical protein [Arthrobacter sp. FB24]|uniref:hypothetical protein n=1 Tax=Arthrobacter sp. (strain FB24) TaxID=290399 RepID=UPI001E46799C|nr:hypothetical protein [Arthrobacter sp. FB24]
MLLGVSLACIAGQPDTGLSGKERCQGGPGLSGATSGGWFSRHAIPVLGWQHATVLLYDDDIPVEGMTKDRSCKIGLKHKGSPVKDFHSIYDLFAGKLPGSWIFSFEGPPSAGLLLLRGYSNRQFLLMREVIQQRQIFAQGTVYGGGNVVSDSHALGGSDHLNVLRGLSLRAEANVFAESLTGPPASTIDYCAHGHVL